jgi:hypothetical protein
MTEQETPVAFIHPETGETLETRADFFRALNEVTERMEPLWRVRRRIREEIADRFEYQLPARRIDRTATQERVFTCPRCGLARVEGDPEK